MGVVATAALDEGCVMKAGAGPLHRLAHHYNANSDIMRFSRFRFSSDILLNSQSHCLMCLQLFYQRKRDFIKLTVNCNNVYFKLLAWNN